MEKTYILSIGALVISIIALYISYKTNKYNLEITNKTNNYLSMIDIEKSLKDIPDALRFHGIEVNELKKNNLDVNEFIYLLNSFTSGTMFYIEGELANEEPFKENSYRYTMLSHPDVQNAWPFLSKMIEDSTYKRKIENTIKKIKKNS